ncbi:hypothetical protein BC833DRAFT_562741 [Globomyces pollinis-pini]|nr:hypothetical protein BC833DRAFT_562741 [Globomyces pollinis-pini]
MTCILLIFHLLLNAPFILPLVLQELSGAQQGSIENGYPISNSGNGTNTPISRVTPFVGTVFFSNAAIQTVSSTATLTIHSIPRSSTSLAAFLLNSFLFVELPTTFKWDSNAFTFRDFISALLSLAEEILHSKLLLICIPSCTRTIEYDRFEDDFKLANSNALNQPLRYSTLQLENYIDGLGELCLLCDDHDKGEYVAYPRSWIKKRLCDILNKIAAGTK